jgi:hypothetical protein
MPSACPPVDRLLSIQETNMLGKTLSLRALPAALAAGLIAGCSSMQPTPMMPSQPAMIGASGGVSSQQDSICRQQAYQAAQKAKETNIAKEVGVTAVGAIAGAVIGNALEPGRGPAPRYPGPRGGPAPRGPSGPQLGTAGGVTGAAVGAAASQSMVQNTQQVYDATYNNCIASYRRY